MLTVYARDSGEAGYRKGNGTLLASIPPDSETFVWIDIAGVLDEGTASMLGERFGLHPMALQDAARDRHPPKIEAFGDHTLLIYKGLAAASAGIDGQTIQIAAFVGERFLITRHSDVSPSIGKLRRELEEDPSLMSRGAGAMAARLTRLIADRYLKVLLDLEPRLEVVERELLGDDAEAILGELVAYRSDLIRLQRVFHYQAEVTGELEAELPPGFRAEDRHAVTDAHEQQARAKSLCTLYYQMSADLIDGYISVSSHRLNQIMRVLTIITAIFVPLSFLAGVYGMNFQNMPELNSRWGYFMLLSIMGSVAATLLWVFRRKRWL